MTADDIEKNVDVSSNPNSAPNLVPKTGGVPDYWRPSPNDDEPSVRVTLPDVNGRSPEEYEVMAIRINAENVDTVTVTVRDTEDNVVFTVSLYVIKLNIKKTDTSVSCCFSMLRELSIVRRLVAIAVFQSLVVACP